MSFLWIGFEILLYLFGALALFLTVMPFSRYSAWWVRIGDFPRLQIAFICLAVVVLSAVYFYPYNAFHIIFMVLLVLAALYQFYCVLPYLPFYPKQVQTALEENTRETVKLLISNVYMENRETEKLIGLIRKFSPDLILLAEVNEFWTNAMSKIEDDYPNTVLRPLENTYGMALYSRLELVEPEIKYIVQDDIPSIHTDVKLRSGREINLRCLHPRPPAPLENHRSAERDAELIIVGKEVEKTEEPTIVCGDLNDVAWSRTTTLFQKISGLLDPRVGRGLYNSFHAQIPFLRMPLDHVFHSNHFRLVRIQRMPSIGSDHFPIFIALNFQNGAEQEQEKPEANGDEKQEAEEKIEEAFEE